MNRPCDRRRNPDHPHTAMTIARSRRRIRRWHERNPSRFVAFDPSAEPLLNDDAFATTTGNPDDEMHDRAKDEMYSRDNDRWYAGLPD